MIKCKKCTLSKIQLYQCFSEDIKISLRGVDNKTFIVHNENVINSVVKTLNSIYNTRRTKKMKVNGITNTFNYSNINNNKQYASRPVFKQEISSITQRAVVDQFIESANDKKYSKSPLVSKISYLKDVLFSDMTTRKVKSLQEAIDSDDSKRNIL